MSSTPENFRRIFGTNFIEAQIDNRKKSITLLDRTQVVVTGGEQDTDDENRYVVGGDLRGGGGHQSVRPSTINNNNNNNNSENNNIFLGGEGGGGNVSSFNPSESSEFPAPEFLSHYPKQHKDTVVGVECSPCGNFVASASGSYQSGDCYVIWKCENFNSSSSSFENNKSAQTQRHVDPNLLLNTNSSAAAAASASAGNNNNNNNGEQQKKNNFPHLKKIKTISLSETGSMPGGDVFQPLAYSPLMVDEQLNIHGDFYSQEDRYHHEHNDTNQHFSSATTATSSTSTTPRPHYDSTTGLTTPKKTKSATLFGFLDRNKIIRIFHLDASSSSVKQVAALPTNIQNSADHICFCPPGFVGKSSNIADPSTVSSSPYAPNFSPLVDRVTVGERTPAASALEASKPHLFNYEQNEKDRLEFLEAVEGNNNNSNNNSNNLCNLMISEEVAIAAGPCNRVYVINWKTKKLRLCLPHTNFAQSVAWSPNGDIIATGTNNVNVKNSVTLWCSQTGARLSQICLRTNAIWQLKFSPPEFHLPNSKFSMPVFSHSKKKGGEFLFVSSHDGHVRILDCRPTMKRLFLQEEGEAENEEEDETLNYISNQINNKNNKKTSNQQQAKPKNTSDDDTNSVMSRSPSELSSASSTISSHFGNPEDIYINNESDHISKNPDPVSKKKVKPFPLLLSFHTGNDCRGFDFSSDLSVIVCSQKENPGNCVYFDIQKWKEEAQEFDGANEFIVIQSSYVRHQTESLTADPKNGYVKKCFPSDPRSVRYTDPYSTYPGRRNSFGYSPHHHHHHAPRRYSTDSDSVYDTPRSYDASDLIETDTDDDYDENNYPNNQRYRDADDPVSVDSMGNDIPIRPSRNTTTRNNNISNDRNRKKPLASDEFDSDDSFDETCKKPLVPKNNNNNNKNKKKEKKKEKEEEKKVPADDFILERPIYRHGSTEGALRRCLFHPIRRDIVIAGDDAGNILMWRLHEHWLWHGRAKQMLQIKYLSHPEKAPIYRALDQWRILGTVIKYIRPMCQGFARHPRILRAPGFKFPAKVDFVEDFEIDVETSFEGGGEGDSSVNNNNTLKSKNNNKSKPNELEKFQEKKKLALLAEIEKKKNKQQQQQKKKVQQQGVAAATSASANDNNNNNNKEEEKEEDEEESLMQLKQRLLYPDSDSDSAVSEHSDDRYMSHSVPHRISSPFNNNNNNNNNTSAVAISKFFRRFELSSSPIFFRVKDFKTKKWITFSPLKLPEKFMSVMFRGHIFQTLRSVKNENEELKETVKKQQHQIDDIMKMLLEMKK